MFGQNDCFSGLDSRYHNKQLDPYLSYNGYIKHLLIVELAIVKIFWQMGVVDINEEVYNSISKACKLVKIEYINQEEARIHHDIRAVVNCICNNLPEEHKFAVHLGAT